MMNVSDVMWGGGDFGGWGGDIMFKGFSHTVLEVFFFQIMCYEKKAV